MEKNGYAKNEVRTMGNNFRQEAELLQDQLVAWRRKLHQEPEVGMTLPKTMEFIRQELEKMEVSYEYFEERACIIATIGEGNRCFLLRSDVDGLPIREETEVPFRATNGNMHGCGHDLHGAMLLGAAKLLKNCKEPLDGCVKLLFQAGEETFEGARAALETGALEDVQAAFAMHVIAMMSVGIILTGKEPMASVDGFKITLTGKGGHGSMPEAAVDPINAAVQVYLALQSLVAREVSGTEEAVLTVGQFQAGDAANVIPEQAVLQGTLRTFKPEVRQRLWLRIEEMSAAVANAYRCGCKIEHISACAGVVTDDGVTAAVKEAVAREMPEARLIEGAHGMGSEDFAQIAQRIPAAYFMMGAGPKDEKKRYGQHNPKIEFNEDVLPLGAAIYAQAAATWLRKGHTENEM